MKAKILVVDDDPDIVMVLKDRLEASGYEVVSASDGAKALEVVHRDPPDLMLLDLAMPQMSGMDVLKTLAQECSENKAASPGTGSVSDDRSRLPIIVMTAHGSVEQAVEAMKEGAYDFLLKPLNANHLTIVIRKALERESLRQQIECLRTELDSPYAQIIGSSPALTSLKEQAERAAKSQATVLLLGESGTGKELFARSIHNWSPRRHRIFTVVNCAAIPDNLLEDELFGHERGAYTGAHTVKRGKLEIADGGTLFLDEIGEMPMHLQPKLLRVLEDQQFERLGGTQPIHVQVRFIAATNKTLEQAIANGSFREDLYYRLRVVSFVIPPLRERTEDILPLAEFFLDRHRRKMNRPGMQFSCEAVEAITRYHWPGNIRELDNAIARAVVLSPHEMVEPQELGLPMLEHRGSETRFRPAESNDLPFHDCVTQYKRDLITDALRQAKGSRTGAAKRLGLQRTYLSKLIQQLGINIEELPR